MRDKALPLSLAGVVLIAACVIFNSIDWQTKDSLLGAGIVLAIFPTVIAYEQVRQAFADRYTYLNNTAPQDMIRISSNSFYLKLSRWEYKKSETLKLLYFPGAFFVDKDGNRRFVVQVYFEAAAKVESRDSYEAIVSFLFGHDQAMVIETDGGQMGIRNEQSISFDNAQIHVGGDFLVNQSFDASVVNNYEFRKNVFDVIEYLDSQVVNENEAMFDGVNLLREMLKNRDRSSPEKKKRIVDFLQSVLSSVTSDAIRKAIGTIIGSLSGVSGA